MFHVEHWGAGMALRRNRMFHVEHPLRKFNSFPKRIKSMKRKRASLRTKRRKFSTVQAS